MSRVEQPAGVRGSLKWIQAAVNERWPDLDRPILSRLPGASSIDWRSPLRGDGYAEYRDAEFLGRLGRSDLAPDLAEFWPSRGPQWDALARTDNGQILLVEAKSHIAEMCSPGTAAGPKSRAKIECRLVETARRLGAPDGHAPWTDYFYQLGNRLAHLEFMRRRAVPAYLVLVNFLNDADMNGPTTAEVWRGAYEVAFHVMGIRRRHALAPYMIEVFPDLALRRSAHA